MKRILIFTFAAAALLFGAASCDKYDDSSLLERLGSVENRVSNLEYAMNQLSDYQTIKDKVNSGSFITSVTPSSDGKSYTIKFSDNSTITIKDGKDGENIKGDPGENGKTPSFKIENEKWYSSYDNGSTWNEVGSAIDRSLISDVKVNGDNLNLTLVDGSEVVLAIGQKNCFSMEIDETPIILAAKYETAYSRKITLPYTLTGVEGTPRFLITVEGENSANVTVALNQTDERSGSIEIKQYAEREFDDGMYLDFYGATAKILCVNGDGQSTLKELKLYDDYWTIFFFEYTWEIRDDFSGVTLKEPLPAEGGVLEFDFEHGIMGVSDPSLIEASDLSQLIEIAASSGYVKIISVTPKETQISTDNSVGNDYVNFRWHVEARVSGNTTGKDELRRFSFNIKTSKISSNGYGWVYYTILGE